MLAQLSPIYNQGVNAVQDGAEYVTAEMTAKWRSNWPMIGMYANHHSSTMKKHYDSAIAFADGVFIGTPHTEAAANSYLRTFAFGIYTSLRDVCFEYDNHMHHSHDVNDPYIAQLTESDRVAA